MDDRNLIAVAEQAAAPSRVLRGPVEGATILAADGRTFLGTRLEFEDPSLDQDALSNGLAAGRVQGMRQVVRAGYYRPVPDGRPRLPREALLRLRELAAPGMAVIVSGGTGEFVERPLEELLAEAGLA